MNRQNIIIIILVVIIIAGAGYIINDRYLIISKDHQLPPYEQQPQDNLPADLTGQQGDNNIKNSDHTNNEDNGYIYASPNVIKSMNIFAEPVDWDSKPGNDGVVIHFLLYDDNGNQIRFSNEKISAEIVIYTPDTDLNRAPVKPIKVLYKGYATITNSDQGLAYPLRGVRVAYDELSLVDNDRGIGKITMKINLPQGQVITGEDEYLYTK